MYVETPLFSESTSYYDYEGTVRLVISMAPWRWVLHLKGIGIAEAGIVTELDRRDLDEEFVKEDLQYLLREGQEYVLQLESADASLTFPIERGRLAGIDRTASGLRLNFQFLTQSDDLSLLLEELEKRPRPQPLH